MGYVSIEVKALAASAALTGWMLFAVLSAPTVRAAATVFFDASQVATLISNGATSDTISSDGYLFTYTRDKLFTGGLGTNPIGRPVRVAWPEGIEAQYVTSGPQTAKASITIRRLDGAVFDVVSFTARLLANAGAGRALEVVPKLDGEEPLNDPLFFDVYGNYGNEFSYDTSPNHLGSTAALTNYDTYVVNLTLDYALVALALESATPNRAPASLQLSSNTVPENEPPGTLVGGFSTSDPDIGDSFTYTLVSGPGSADNAEFSIIGADLFAEASFNHEAQASHTIRVRTTDQGGLWCEQAFAISVLDVYEPPPELSAPLISPEGQAVLTWSSVPNHVYAVLQSTNLSGGFSPLATNIPATPPINSYTDSITGLASKFWKVSTRQ